MTPTEARFIRAVVGDKIRISQIGPYRLAWLRQLYTEAMERGGLYRKFLGRRKQQ